jgi:transposase
MPIPALGRGPSKSPARPSSLRTYYGTIARIHDKLYVESRERSGRAASPTTAILDAQTAKCAVKGGARSTRPATMPGKRFSAASAVLVDTQGLLLNVGVHAADIQDRDGAETLLRQARRRFPFIERIVADGGYAGPKMSALVARTGDWTLQIVKRSDVRGFVVLPKRWIVERTLAWISRTRRLSRDYERQTRIAVAFAKLAMIRIMLRRTAVTHSS